MKTRLRHTVSSLAVLLFVVGSFVSIVGVSAFNKGEPAPAAPAAAPKALPDVPGTVSGAAKPASIPEDVAYELFLRALAGNSARQSLKDAGFNGKEIDHLLQEAKAFAASVAELDRRAQELKSTNRKDRSDLVQAELASIQRKKEEFVAKVQGDALPKGLGLSGFKRLKAYVDSQVKTRTKRVPTGALAAMAAARPARAAEFSFVKASAPSAPPRFQGGGSVYLYSNSWVDGPNVFGSGTLSEDYTSYTNYMVTTTVTSPSGSRSSTSQNGWSYATISNAGGLSVGVEDGTYNVQATFEAQDGYYDEWGNFVGYGSYYVGSASSSVFVAPQITIAPNVTVSPSTSTVSGGSLTITASIAFSAGYPATGSAVIELNEISNQGGVSYSVADRSKSVAANPGASRTVDFSIRVNTPSNPGTVNSQLRIESTNPATGVTIGNNNVNVAFSVIQTASTGGGTGGGTGVCTTAGWGGGCPGGTSWNGSSCCQYTSPLLLDVDGDGFEMTDYYEGVPFDISGSGRADKVSWTAPGSDDAWLVLDRNGNNRIDDGTEMFGDAAAQPVTAESRNGFAALAMFDDPLRGGNGDGRIDRRDAVFSSLRLWQDKNHNGHSEPEELFRLPALDVAAVELAYKESKRTDDYGNRFRYRAKVSDARRARVGRWAWDVFLRVCPPAQH